MEITEKWIIATDEDMLKMWQQKDNGDKRYSEIKLVTKNSTPTKEFLREMFLKESENFWLVEIDKEKTKAEDKFMYLEEIGKEREK